MSGGITQLVAIGAQDVHLVGNPEVSFFQSSYKRHTNFAQLVDRQIIQGNPGAGGISTVTFERKGDMLGHVYITAKRGSQVQAKTGAEWTSIIKSIDFMIGGQVIDTHDSVFSEYLAVELMATCLSKSRLATQHNGIGHTSYFYPLRFSFCENWQSMLPLVALQYHDVQIRINWKTPVISPVETYEVYANFVYLDTNERRMMADKSHLLLINQVQKSIPSGTGVQDLVFNHPIKYICAANDADGEKPAWCTDTNTVKMQMNGTDLADFKPCIPCFTDAVTYYCCPYSTGSDIFVYPFCLDTGKLQPTGSVNFSRLDSCRLILNNGQTFASTATFYAVNYNVLKIQNGMAGLLYSS